MSKKSINKKCRLLWFAAGAIWLFLAAAWTLRPAIQIKLEPASIQADSGHAYTAPIRRIFFPFTFPDDRDSKSTLQLLENGKNLGPAHMLHRLIRERGKGAFSHWGDTIFFSSGDGTDPRTNGYYYVVIGKLQPHSVFSWLGIVITSIAILFTLLINTSGHSMTRFDKTGKPGM